jgi:hypothetical protein
MDLARQALARDVLGLRQWLYEISREPYLPFAFVEVLHISIFTYIYLSEVGGSESAFRQAPRNREIVLFCACMRRAVFGCEEDSKCKSKARAFSLFPQTPFPFPL